MKTFRAAVRSLLREQVLDAAYEQVAAFGWDKIRLAVIARNAGVSRQAVYNEFGSKDAIGLALVEREAERFLVGIQEQLDAHRDDLDRAIAAGVDFTLREAADNPLIKAILTASRGGEDTLLAYLTTRPEPVFNTAIAMLDAYVADAWPDIDPESRNLAVEAVVRLTVSHMVQPTSPHDETAQRIADIVTRTARPCLPAPRQPDRGPKPTGS
ncbi:TetR family transcriptional regulator [Streptomyces albogriseolus]|uniref:TetR/AcrR family transcriptional regulator n=1 Tax=Streptomyces TaxID=1883 RepID=UPI001414ECD4|nr:TetR family transcriptional regulator [Streptomyces sp. GC420]MBC7273056.1 TetR/AcrR family transcriptional regulator [Streptomyces sp.]NBM14189.1 TetR family transcriptional regulator [Streptomyces sp. GC420]